MEYAIRGEDNLINMAFNIKNKTNMLQKQQENCTNATQSNQAERQKSNFTIHSLSTSVSPIDQ